MDATLELLQLEMDKSINVARKVVRRFGAAIPYLFAFRPADEDTLEVEPIPVDDAGMDFSVEGSWKALARQGKAPYAVGAICGVEMPDKSGAPTQCIYTCLYTDMGAHVTHRLTQYRIIDEISDEEREFLRDEYWKEYQADHKEEAGEGGMPIADLRERFDAEAWPRLEPHLHVEFLEYLWDDVDAHMAPLMPLAS